jgi:hypothetical protein
MQLFEGQPEYITSKCSRRVLTKIYDGVSVSEKEVLESVVYSGYDEAKGFDVTREFDGNGNLIAIWESAKWSDHRVEYNESGEVIADDRCQQRFDSENRHSAEIRSDIDGNTSEIRKVYNRKGEVTELVFVYNGIETSNIVMPVDKVVTLDDGSVKRESWDGGCIREKTTESKDPENTVIHEAFDQRGNCISRQVDRKYSEDLRKSLIIQDDGDFFKSDILQVAEAEALVLNNKNEQQVKIFTNEEYDDKGELTRMAVSVGSHCLLPYEKRTYYPETNTVELYRMEMHWQSNKNSVRYEKVFTNGILTLEKTSYLETEKLSR